MKTKIFFLFAMLANIAASATVTVTPLNVDYASKKVTFKIAWTGNAANNRVWVWVDLCPVIGTLPSTFAKAVISEATGNGIVAGTLNGRGFYVNVSGATVTATLSNATEKFNWCAYGSDFPPNAVNNGSGYTLKGSPPFIITTSSGTEEVIENTYSGGTITAITDATGCPGVLCGKNGESSGLLNCCVSGTTNCSGTCKTTGTYTTNDGACTGACNTAYVQQRNQCGIVINDKYSTYTNTGCTTPNYTTNDGACTGACNTAYVQLRNACGIVMNSQHGTYTNNNCTQGCGPTFDPTCRGLLEEIVSVCSDCPQTCRSYKRYQCYVSIGGDYNTYWCNCCN
jgi:hypothetical protein